MTQENLINYAEEAKKVKEYIGGWFKPSSGKYKIKFLEEPKPVTKEIKDKVVDQIETEIELNNQNTNWSITKGKGVRSLYGQLMLVAEDRGKLKDETINLIVKGSGQDIDYTVTEAIDLIPTSPPEEMVN